MMITRRTAAVMMAATLAGSLQRSPLAADAPVYREFIEGNAAAKVVVIEYASLTCHFCADFHTKSFPRLKADYIDTGKIKFIYRDYPTDGLATGAALLARCAPGDRGKAMIDMLFKSQHEWAHAEKPLDPLRGYAQLAGMAPADIDACLKNSAILDEIKAVQKTAGTLYRVQATPTFFVGEAKIEGDTYEALKQAIDRQLK